MQMSFEDTDEALVGCKIVCIHLFRSNQSILVNVVLIDKEGLTLEAKSWSTNKAYYVYFNFKENQHVMLRCKPNFFRKTDDKYSSSDFETNQRGWTLAACKQTFQPKKPIPAFYDIDAFHASPSSAKSIVGIFVEMGGGPLKWGPNGRLMARGHYTKFRDSKNRLYQALVWENPNRKFAFPLSDCKPGDPVLLPYARTQDQRYRHSKLYTITTVYPPIVESKCLSKPKVAQLKYYDKYEASPYEHENNIAL